MMPFTKNTNSSSNDVRNHCTTNTPMHFSPKQNNNDNDVPKIITFVEACQLASESHQLFHLSQDT